MIYAWDLWLKFTVPPLIHFQLEIDFTHLALVYGIDRIFIVDGDIGPHGDGTIIDMIGDDPNQATTFYTTGPNVTIMLTSAPSSWAEGRTVFNTVVTEVPPSKGVVYFIDQN